MFPCLLMIKPDYCFADTLVLKIDCQLANEDKLLPTQMFPRLSARATFVADTNFVFGTQKIFLILFRNILCPGNKCFPVSAAQETWATMCPRLPGPEGTRSKVRWHSYTKREFKGLITWARLARSAGLVSVCQDLGSFVKRHKNQLTWQPGQGPVSRSSR